MKTLHYIAIGIVIAAVIGSIIAFESLSMGLEKDNGNKKSQLNGNNNLNSSSSTLPNNSTKGMDTDKEDD